MLLCDDEKKADLDYILRENLHPPNNKLLIENDAIDKKTGKPVLFTYLIDMPRLARFVSALELQEQNGTIICFDFQKNVLSKYCGEIVEFDTIIFEEFKKRFYQ